MKILIDTNFFYGITDCNDSHNKLAIELMESIDWNKYSAIFTTNLVVSETYTLLMYRSRNKIPIFKGLDDLFWGNNKFFNIIFPTPYEYQKISKTMKKYSSKKKKLSFVDASLIFFGKKYSIGAIISFDSHFDGIFTRIM